MCDSIPSLDDQFTLAVDCIKNLPSEGSFKPSYELMLNFYALYKQATVGSCKEAKPYAWDVKGRYKWDAWHKLKEMSSDEAKLKYVEKLAELLEVLPVTEEVQKLGPVFGPFLKTVLKKDIRSDETSANRDVKNIEQSADVPQELIKNSSIEDTDGDEENFCDTQTDIQFEVLQKPPSTDLISQSHGSIVHINNGQGIHLSLNDLHSKVDKLVKEIESIRSFMLKFNPTQFSRVNSRGTSNWLQKISKNPNFIIVLIIAWPFVAHLITKWFSKLLSS